MTAWKPFDADGEQRDVGGLTLENVDGGVRVSGDLSIGLDRRGLRMATALAAAAQALVARLEAGGDLPELARPERMATERAPNPLAE